jgi:polyisoprenoid-binding protein YceI
MTVTNLTILAETTVGTPSGNYDGSTNYFNSDGQKAVNYYQGQGSLQTVAFRVTGFQGVITLQATLDNNVNSEKWFDVYTYGDASSIVTDYHPVPITGNFTWVRVAVTGFDAGTINFVNISY